MLPGWQRSIQPLVDSGEIVAIGVVQEQHPDRARLYKQWRELDWPILVDSLNVLGFKVVPIPMALDEAGVIQLNRRFRPEQLAEFAKRPPTPAVAPKNFNRLELPDPRIALKVAKREQSAAAWRACGDALFLGGDAEQLGRAAEAYGSALKRRPEDALSHFRLGVTLRRRSESAGAESGDAQAAVAEWGTALALDPNQYIWRRRIQQYGPRQNKPYNFYFWITEAREAIRARGEEPLPLLVEPRGSEVVAKGESHGDVQVPDPDPQGKIDRDQKRVVVETIVTPARVRPGERVRVRARLRLTDRAKWNNEGEPLTLSARVPASFRVPEGAFVYPVPEAAESAEDRYLEFEIAVPAGAEAGEIVIPLYALYNICESETGVCRFVRHDTRGVVVVDPQAPKL